VTKKERITLFIMSL